MAKTLDAQVEAFRSRRMDAGPYTFLWLDALTRKVREAGRTVIVHGSQCLGERSHSCLGHAVLAASVVDAAVVDPRRLGHIGLLTRHAVARLVECAEENAYSDLSELMGEEGALP